MSVAAYLIVNYGCISAPDLESCWSCSHQGEDTTHQMLLSFYLYPWSTLLLDQSIRVPGTKTLTAGQVFVATWEDHWHRCNLIIKPVSRQVSAKMKTSDAPEQLSSSGMGLATWAQLRDSWGTRLVECDQDHYKL